MICINCFHSSTSVTNSRPHKTMSSVWRRRICRECRAVFTTVERPDLRFSTINIDHDKAGFNLGKLIISIAAAFQHDPNRGIEHASALADTVVSKLSLHPIITSDTIAAETLTALKHFDQKAALAYQLQHQLVD